MPDKNLTIGLVVVGVCAAAAIGGSIAYYAQRKENEKNEDEGHHRHRRRVPVPHIQVPVVGRPFMNPFAQTRASGFWGSGPWANRVPVSRHHGHR